MKDQKTPEAKTFDCKFIETAMTNLYISGTRIKGRNVTTDIIHSRYLQVSEGKDREIEELKAMLKKFVDSAYASNTYGFIEEARKLLEIPDEKYTNGRDLPHF